jgi:uncharacterized protein (UPF0248 family)
MNTSKQIVYTDAAKERLEKLRGEILEQIEVALRENKSIPGDRIIEVTESDIEQLARSMEVVFYQNYKRKLESRQLILNVYFVMGILTIVGAFFYPEFRSLVSNPIRAALLATGLLMLVVTYMMRQYLKGRDQMKAEFFEKADRFIKK